MRIAFITLGYAPLRTSGLDVSGERLVRALLADGHHVIIIAGARGAVVETQAHPELEIYRVPIGRADWISFAYRAAQLLRRLNDRQPFDVAHFWDVHFAYAYRGRFVGSLHQSFRQRWKSWDSQSAGKWSLLHRFTYYSSARVLAEVPSLRRAEGLLAVSSTTRDEFIKNYQLPPSHIALARHGIDVDFFRRTPAAHTLRAQLGIEPREPVILFAGFVTPRKGLEYLARAVPFIHPSPRLVIVGHWSESYRSRFLRVLGSSARQVVEAGFVSDDQMPAYYSLADVYVSTSLLEGFGLPLAESLACETPVVAAASGATAEVVGPGGMLIPPKDPAALANAVSELLDNPGLRGELGKQGRDHIKREFTIQAMLGNTLKAYERFLLTESGHAA